MLTDLEKAIDLLLDYIYHLAGGLAVTFVVLFAVFYPILLAIDFVEKWWKRRKAAKSASGQQISFPRNAALDVLPDSLGLPLDRLP